MPRKFTFLSILILLVIGLMSSCQNFTPTKEKIPGPLTQAVTITPSLTPLPSSTLQPTYTPQPSATPAPLGCADMQGKVEHRQMDDANLGKPLVVNVYLPPCYNQNKKGGYPVLILLHGQSFTASQWVDLGVPVIADRLMVTGQLPPFLVVMPQEDYYLEDLRQSKFGDSVTLRLLPWIGKEYNSCGKRECTAIGGLSRGAIWAVMLGLQNEQLFSSIGAHSLANNPFQLFILRDLLKAFPDKPRIYIDSGNLDLYLKSAIEFEDSLNELHLQHTWILRDGAHNSLYWASHVEEYLRWYATPWQKHP